jgi:predicted AAA+ superfamily ATPase
MARTVTIPRLLQRPERSFFLFGPRGTGKSTWLQQVLPDAFRLDLLDSSLFLELSRDPHRLEALIGSRPAGTRVVLDEIQKVPPSWTRFTASWNYAAGGLPFADLQPANCDGGAPTFSRVAP